MPKKKATQKAQKAQINSKEELKKEGSKKKTSKINKISTKESIKD
jgi:hypothetical protein